MGKVTDRPPVLLTEMDEQLLMKLSTTNDSKVSRRQKPGVKKFSLHY